MTGLPSRGDAGLVTLPRELVQHMWVPLVNGEGGAIYCVFYLPPPHLHTSKQLQVALRSALQHEVPPEWNRYSSWVAGQAGVQHAIF